MNLPKLLPLLALAALLAACGKAVPPEKLDYVGEWREKNMALRISADGRVKYKRVKDHSTTSIDAPLQAFNGDDFEVGIGMMTTTFVVTRPPFRDEEDQWKMVVDGVELVKSPEGSWDLEDDEEDDDQKDV